MSGLQTAPILQPVEAAENPITVLRKQLTDHIRDCSAQQRRVLWGLIAIIGWLVGHDPKVLEFLH